MSKDKLKKLLIIVAIIIGVWFIGRWCTNFAESNITGSDNGLHDTVDNM